MKRFCTLLSLTLTFFSVVYAQVNTEAKNDTTSLLYQKYFGTLDENNNRIFPRRYVSLNPDYYRLFVPMTFYRAPVDQITELKWNYSGQDNLPDLKEVPLPFNVDKYVKKERVNRRVNSILLTIYANNPELVKNTEQKIKSIKVLTEEETITHKPKTSVLSLFQPDVAIEDVRKAKVIIQKPNFWTTGGDGSVQFTQNYISENWYNGGESTNSLLSNVKLYANYNDKQKIQFENVLEARIGFNSSPSDTIRKYKINTDVLRLFSKLGIQAISTWYYTVSAELNTQFFDNHKANSDDVASTFFAPAYFSASIGMDYKLQKEKVNLSVIMSPLSYKLTYVGDSRVDETAYGIEEGKKSLNDYGSKFQTTLSWKIIPNITYDSRLYYFTSYDKVQAEWENTVNFVLNRYLSTKLFVHVRYDDGVARVEDKSYFQVKELLSFGLNYKW